MRVMACRLMVVLGALAWSGCGGASDNPVVPSRPPVRGPGGEGPVVTAGPGGTTGHNGLAPASYHNNKVQLEALMTQAVTLGGSSKIQPAFDALLAAPDGRELMKKAALCALSGVQLTHASGPIDVDGYMKTTGGWRGAPLASAGLRGDLHTCLVTLLNPNFTVDIWLSGPSVRDDGPPTGFDCVEGVWIADVQRAEVWPNKALEESCGEQLLQEGINRRICGDPKGGCAITLHSAGDLSKDCTLGAAGYTCHTTRAAIETRLKCTDFGAVYPGCKPPAPIAPRRPKL